VVLIFGVHSAIDWTWFVPANAATALLCAGWMAGRGPLRARLESRGAETGAAATTSTSSGLWAATMASPGASSAAGGAHDESGDARGLIGHRAAWARRRLAALGDPRGVRTAAAALVLVIALIACWWAYQPVRSLHASNAAFDRLDRGAPAAAAAVARIAVDRNPLSADPLFDLATIEQARGNTAAARSALERAVRLQPADAETWRRLGELQLGAMHDAQAALRDFRAAYFLDPKNPQSVSDVIEATRAAGG
jgi:cytochrome c-type biogenesis protein CcmH/NrfG